MAEYTANSELSGSESKHDGQAMPEGHRWTKVMPDAEGAAACWACGSRALRFGRPHARCEAVWCGCPSQLCSSLGGGVCHVFHGPKFAKGNYLFVAAVRQAASTFKG